MKQKRNKFNIGSESIDVTPDRKKTKNIMKLRNPKLKNQKRTRLIKRDRSREGKNNQD